MSKRETHHVVPSKKGGWDIKRGGSTNVISHYDRKDDTVDRCRIISRNQGTEMIIHKKNGKISRADSHGKDPCPPKDKK